MQDRNLANQTCASHTRARHGAAAHASEMLATATEKALEGRGSGRGDERTQRGEDWDSGDVEVGGVASAVRERPREGSTLPRLEEDEQEREDEQQDVQVQVRGSGSGFSLRRCGCNRC